jgi:hypothetical protein
MKLPISRRTAAEAANYVSILILHHFVSATSFSSKPFPKPGKHFFATKNPAGLNQRGLEISSAINPEGFRG